MYLGEEGGGDAQMHVYICEHKVRLYYTTA